MQPKRRRTAVEDDFLNLQDMEQFMQDAERDEDADDAGRGTSRPLPTSPSSVMPAKSSMSGMSELVPAMK